MILSVVMVIPGFTSAIPATAANKEIETDIRLQQGKLTMLCQRNRKHGLLIMINMISVIDLKTLDKREAVKNARKAYESLTDAQRERGRKILEIKN